jgi:hypothetical protein
VPVLPSRASAAICVVVFGWIVVSASSLSSLVLALSLTVMVVLVWVLSAGAAKHRLELAKDIGNLHAEIANLQSQLTALQAGGTGAATGTANTPPPTPPSAIRTLVDKNADKDKEKDKPNAGTGGITGGTGTGAGPVAPIVPERKDGGGGHVVPGGPGDRQSAAALASGAVALWRAQHAPFMMEVDGARVFLSGDLMGWPGDNVLEARKGMSDGRHLFRLLRVPPPPNAAGPGAAARAKDKDWKEAANLYRIMHVRSSQFLFASNDFLKGDRVMEGAYNVDEPRAHFSFESTSNEPDGETNPGGALAGPHSFRIRDASTGEYLFLSSDKKGIPGDFVVEARKGIKEARSIFRFLNAEGKPIAP